ncbi:hypothetical protein EBB07_28725 [Paenibacillaceae bacterium]|nr:hypothetical protein EBB07_28725 [Paenibacillaceae bacterium]
MEFKKFKEVHIVLENCEAYRITWSNLKSFSISDISKRIYKHENRLGTSFYCKHVFMKISKESNLIDCQADSFPVEWKKPVLDRLTEHADIVALDIIYEDGTNEYIYVDWVGDSDYVNPVQLHKFCSQTGDLFIAITQDAEMRNEYFEYN